MPCRQGSRSSLRPPWLLLVAPMALIAGSSPSHATARQTKLAGLTPVARSVAKPRKPALSLSQRGEHECGENRKRPASVGAMKCPSRCPFVRPDTQKFCSFACVTATGCDNRNPLTSFADPEAMVCSACLAPGCDICSTRKTCAQCMEGFTLLDGHCMSARRWFWYYFYCILGIIGIVVVMYIICLFNRPVVNQKVVDKALKYWDWSRTFRNVKVEADAEGHTVAELDSARDSIASSADEDLTQRPQPDTEKGELRKVRKHQLWPLETNLCKQDVSGTGVRLFFKWQSEVMQWAAALLLVLVILAALSGAVDRDTLPGDRDIVEACADDGGHEARQARLFERWFFIIVLAAYVFSTFGVIWMAVEHQKIEATAEIQGFRIKNTLKDFGAMISGFPVGRKGEVQLEAQYTQFFREAFPAEIFSPEQTHKDRLFRDKHIVVGVSICWDLYNYKGELDFDGQIKEELDEMDRVKNRSSNANAESSVEAEGAQQRMCPTPQMQFIDPALLRLYLGLPSPDDAKLTKEAEEVADELAKLESTADAFVVFNTMEQRNQAYEAVKEGKVKLDFKGVDGQIYPLEFVKCHRQPEAVLWEGFGCSDWQNTVQLIKACVMLFVAVIAWAVIFYLPYAQYVLSWSRVSGMSQGSAVQGLLLGIVIALGNQIIYFLCQFLFQNIGYKWKGTRDRAYVISYTLAIFFNTCLDLWMVLHLAYGYQSDQALKLASSSGVLGTKALSRHPSLQNALYVQLLAYLFPGTLLIPFMLEPLFTYLMPYFLGLWLIRSRADVHEQDAEDCLVGAPFDLTRYGDIVINVSLVVLVFFLASVEMWRIFLYLTLSCLFIYVWDQYRLLRVVQRSYYGSGIQNRAALDMLCFPCGLLAACVVYRIYALENNHFVDRLPDAVQPNMSRVTVWYFMGFVFVIHCVLHLWAVNALPKRLLKEKKSEEGKGRPYKKAASLDPCNWFNANPIHCLRTKYIFERDGDHWCRPYRLGREYLLTEEPVLAQYYVQPEFANDDEVVQGALDGLKRVGAGAYNKLGDLRKRLKSDDADAAAPDDSPDKTSPAKS